jgi:3-phenylpropionate/trans-cinnamate dioxygenase ferredoxin reductase component
MSDPGMVIIGGGKAGARAAIGFRENGWEGSITIISDEALLPYDRPPLSKAAITDEADPLAVLLLDEGMITSLGVTFMGGAAATSIDRSQKIVHLANGSEVPYYKLLIATGAEPRRLTTPGAERALMLRDLRDAVEIRNAFVKGKNIAVIGGGFIGLELAASAVSRGCKVTVIEAQPRILMRGVPEAISTVIKVRHETAGTNVMAGTNISHIDATHVVLSDGRKVAADIIIAGIGAVPRTQLAEQAGLTIDNGIACDAGMRTSDPDIFASGDCCSFPHPIFADARLRFEAWRNASDQAEVAAENMLGGDKKYQAIPWFWSDQHDLTLQIAGMPALGMTVVTREIKDGAFILCHLDADNRLVGASGVGPGNTIARDVRLLELLIGKFAKPDLAILADGAAPLKPLLKA